MFSFEGYEKLSIDSKGSLINVLSQIPFFYLSIYLFNYDLYLKNDLFINFALCLSLAIFLFVVNVSAKAISLKNKSSLYVVNGADTIIGLGISILITYIFFKTTDIKYSKFLIILFIVTLVLNLIDLIMRLFSNNSEE